MLSKNLFRIPSSVIGRFSLVPTFHWMQEKCASTKKQKIVKTVSACTESTVPVNSDKPSEKNINLVTQSP